MQHYLHIRIRSLKTQENMRNNRETGRALESECQYADFAPRRSLSSPLRMIELQEACFGFFKKDLTGLRQR